ncbi:MAG TPA: CRTAC1 family protein, partial [Pyrinomonadaceae bacterium]|nr:CRTAC1 family protein [Pyrinomonadaceae bacterium]
MMNIVRPAFILLAAALAGCSGSLGTETSGPGIAEPTLAFTDKTKESGVIFAHQPTRTEKKWLPEIMGSGVAVVDIDRDGDADILLVNSGAVGVQERTTLTSNRLFVNNGKGKFTDETDKWGFKGSGYGQGVAVGDFDNDGWHDVLLTNLEGDNRLLRNTGERFEDVSEAANLRKNGKWATSAGFLDVDGDGDLDLYVVRYVEFSISDDRPAFRNRVPIYPTPVLFTPISDQILINDGKGRFTDESVRFGLTNAPRKGLALANGDFDLDGRADIYVANDTEANQLWINQPSGSFREICGIAGCAYSDTGRGEGSMGADLSDIDSNGRPDVAVTNFQDEVTSIYSQTAPLLFEEVADRVGIGRSSRARLSFGIDLFDANNDGLEDLLFVNGHIEDNINLNSDTVTFPQQNSLFLNIGDGKFRDVSDTSGDALKDIQVSRGLATGDLNGDGLIDFVVNNNGGTAQIAFNNSPRPGNFVMLWLEGSMANRSAIGARLVAKIGERTIERQVMGAQSYLSMSDLRVHFGLGPAEKID